MIRRILPVLALLAFAPAAFADAPVRHWGLNFPDSKITFRATQMGTEFQGFFLKYAPDINFDPDRLDKSSVKVVIDTSSISTGDYDRDSTAIAKEWFDTAHFPAAAFESHAFKKTGPNSYVADGTLTIKNISLPLQLPFTLEITKTDSTHTRGHMKAAIVLDRSKFGLGTGQWADTSVIANKVSVDIDILAGTN